MADFIEAYVEETSKVPSPEIYRLWSAITGVSGVLERKCWTTLSAGPLYPHLFTVLVGPPGAGKDNAIRPIRELWSKMSGLNISPDNVTKAALIDALGKSLRTVMNGGGEPYIFSCMVAPCPEFGVFFSHHDLEFLSVLNHMYSSPPVYKEERRTSGVIEVVKPHLVFLSGTQPDYLNTFMPDEAWGMGFTSRLIMIYADSCPPVDLFSMRESRSSELVVAMRKIFELKGEFAWSKNAIDELNTWNRAGCPPQPSHSKLLNYNTRRALHVIKLSMVSAVSRSYELKVLVEDVERARDWLLDAERVMPDIFRAMGQRSDQQVLADLHLYLYRMWSSVAIEKRKPLTTKNIYEFLHSRVTSEKIPRLLEVAEKLGYIVRGRYPDEWTPSAIRNFGNG